MTIPIGLYIHIPFCHARCGYCDFVTFTGQEDRRDSYIEQLCAELKRYAPQTLHTVFLGGGTPSVLEPYHIQQLFDVIHAHFDLPEHAELTLEANPESLTPDKLAGWHQAGINRLSIGLQAYDDELLKAMGRLHTTAEFSAAYALARQAGFSNINVDLIYGFPGQTVAGWMQTIDAVLTHQPDHVSMYSLTVEEHTPFAKEGHEVDADSQAEMYELARARLKDQGFAQYEISNFARPGRECRHNLIYWRGENYLGAGVGAVGTVDGVRWQNVKSLEGYARLVNLGEWPRASTENLTAQERRFERLMLGLRLREGFPWDSEMDSTWQHERRRLKDLGWLEEIGPDVWRIPDPYVALTNQILLPFLNV